MKTYDVIKSFSQQFAYEPVIENVDRLGHYERFIIVGMGGSHLAGDLVKIWKQKAEIIVHQDYGLPLIKKEEVGEYLVIASSYSGNTEEVIDAFDMARATGFASAALSVGGALLQRAKEAGIPYIQMPDIGIQPRFALGYSTKALLKLMGEEEALSKISMLAQTLDAGSFEDAGRSLAERLYGKIPLVYSSSRNGAIAYNWKIKFNETAKIPAFSNIFPEFNHNEMTGFDCVDSTRGLSENFQCIFLNDAADDPRIQKRMAMTEKLLNNRGMRIEIAELSGENIFEKIFSSLICADWTSYFLAGHYSVDPEHVPMVEEFKKLIE